MVPIHIGVDLGTTNVLINVRGKGIVINEPSVVALDRNSGHVLAVGKKAVDMLGRTPPHIVAVRPLQAGVVTNFAVTESMLRYFLQRITRWRTLHATVCVPADCTGVERRAVREAVLGAGAAKVWLVEEPVAAAYGAGIDMKNINGSMIVDCGGGTTDIAVLSMGTSVVRRSTRTAGNSFDEAIARMLRKDYGLIVGGQVAEELKFNLASAVPPQGKMEMEVHGSDVVNGLPRAAVVSADRLYEALSEPLNELVQAIKSVLGRTPPNLAGDLCASGMVLTGGGGLLKGLAEFLQHEIGIPAVLAESPLQCVSLGTVLVSVSRLEQQEDKAV